MDTVRSATGLTPILYKAPAAWHGMFVRTAYGVLLSGGDNFGADLWVANWSAPCPVVPIAWTNWQFWQKGIARGVPGIPGDAHVDVFNGPEEALRAYARVNPVPEPETWATILAGLGLLGLAARRRRSATQPSAACGAIAAAPKIIAA